MWSLHRVVLFCFRKLNYSLTWYMNFVPQLRKLRYPSEIKTLSLRFLHFALSDLELDNHCPARLVKCYSCPPPFIVIISY